MITVKDVKDMPNGVALMGYTGFLSVADFVKQLEKQGYDGTIYVNNKQTTIYMERVSWTHATNAHGNFGKMN